jgi:hypothetical protein
VEKHIPKQGDAHVDTGSSHTFIITEQFMAKFTYQFRRITAPQTQTTLHKVVQIVPITYPSNYHWFNIQAFWRYKFASDMKLHIT